MLVLSTIPGASWEVPDRQALTRIENTARQSGSRSGAAQTRHDRARCMLASHTKPTCAGASLLPSQGGLPCGTRAAASSQASASCATKLRPPFRWARRHARPGGARSVLTGSCYQQVRFEAELRNPSYEIGPDAGAQRQL